MRYIIIGAGAVGGAIGGRLFEGGREVVLVARGAHYRALAEKGLTLTTPDGTAVLPVPAADRPEGVDLRPDGLATPVNSVLQRLADRDARLGRGPGSTTPAELAALIAKES